MRPPKRPRGTKRSPKDQLHPQAGAIRAALDGRAVVLIGLMGAGKTAVGRRLAVRLGLPFVDSDAEIETAAGKTIKEIFSDHGEQHFRDGERRVIARLLGDGEKILATGGGAFIDPDTRATVAERSVSIWLKADLDILLKRVKRRNNRPLLQGKDAREVLAGLIDVRYPVYALADMTVETREVPHEQVVTAVVDTLMDHLSVAAPRKSARRRTSTAGRAAK